ncbi:MAG TPA: transglycosylase SLT domain-containing protein [Ktedonobacterales bacterium]|nr:transglycosylase SLT domain-containing protein [Ktedonobacterales bacterium]
MRRNVIICVMLVMLVGVGLLWLKPGSSQGLFLDSLDWTSNATPAASAAVPSGSGTLKAFGLVGPASCRTSEPPTGSPWLAVAHADAQKYKIDPLVFDWKIWQESGFNPTVHNSPAGAIGIAQFMPGTAAGMGIDPRNPRQALDASARLDAAHLQQYAAQARRLASHYGGWSARYGYALALAAYNAGSGAVQSAWDQAFASAWPSSPWAWLGLLGAETQRYIPDIINCSVA